MDKRSKYFSFWPVLALVLCVFIIASVVLSRSVTVLSEQTPLERKHCYIIDAGHGGVDGGATSCTGILESNMNLQIAMRLDDMMRLLGMQTKMIRTEDISVYTDGQTIAAKKVSDLKERVRLIQEEENPILVSIHMNHFTDSRYFGPQVFYANTDSSKEIATGLQNALKINLVPNNNRQPKAADGVYLLQHIRCPGVLIECGFISNFEENARLNDPQYQKKLCAVIAANLSGFSSNA